MLDPRYSPPSAGNTRWVVLGFVVLLVVLFAAEIAVNFEPVKLSILFVLLLWMPLVALHEAGHAVVAALLGWRVCKVVIGFDRPVFKFRIGQTPVEIRRFPIEGFVQPAPKNLVLPRLKSSLIYAAGPGIEALLLAGLVGWLGYEKLTTPTESIPLILAQSLAVAILLGLFFTLLPITVSTGRGQAWSDGLGILFSFLLPQEHFRQALAAAFLIEAEDAKGAGDLPAAIAACRRGLEEHPGHFTLSLLLAEFLLDLREPQQAREILETILERTDLAPAVRKEIEALRARAMKESIWPEKPRT